MAFAETFTGAGQILLARLPSSGGVSVQLRDGSLRSPLRVWYSPSLSYINSRNVDHCLFRVHYPDIRHNDPDSSQVRKIWVPAVW